MKNILVVANETVAGRELVESLKRRAKGGKARVTVVCPISRPSEGYVVYEDTRRAAAGRRLERLLFLLREAGIPAHGLVVEADPVSAVRDAFGQQDVDEVVISTHPEERSGWLRRNVVEGIRRAAGDVPVEHVVDDLDRDPDAPTNVLVLANETVLGAPLLQKVRDRARESPASFLLLCPQSDPGLSEHPVAERRLRRALAILRSEGIDAHGQIAHPDPHTAAMHAVRDERTDEIIVSTFPQSRGSSWLRRDLVDRLRRDTGLPVEHVEVEPSESETVEA